MREHVHAVYLSAETELPAFRYRLSGRVNKAVWEAPLPLRLQRWLSHHLYRSPPVDASRVIQILDALERAGVDACLSGGWGVSALAGRQVRRHHDLDLVIFERDEPQAVAALAGLGFHVGYREDSDKPMFRRVVLRDHEVHGHVVDLHPVPMRELGGSVTIGIVAGQRVSCLSADEQLAARQGYRRRVRDLIDTRSLRWLLGRTATTLIVPVAGAEELVQASARERGMPPHVTVLYPFLPEPELSGGALAELAGLAARYEPFEFTLTRPGRFPGVRYLAPEPSEPFVALTEAVVGCWPDHPPYRGAFAKNTPHLTVAYGDGEHGAPPLAPGAEAPKFRAEELWLMARRAGRWECQHRFRLGSGR